MCTWEGTALPFTEPSTIDYCCFATICGVVNGVKEMTEIQMTLINKSEVISSKSISASPLGFCTTFIPPFFPQWALKLPYNILPISILSSQQIYEVG